MIKQLITISVLVFVLAGCSSISREPTLSASGYFADDGVVRIWTKISGDEQPMRLLRVYTPFSGDTVSTYYEYLDGKLSLIRSEVQNRDKLPSLMLRLDSEGNPSFMVRKLIDRNEQLSSDDILRLKYEEQRARMTSMSLNAGRVRLHQGYVSNGKIISCQGEAVTPAFPPEQQRWIEKRIRNGGFISLAWLTAPGGVQLLLVANENFCHWEPQIETF